MELTNREKEVLDLMSQGYSNKEIAEKLFITIYTAKAHVSSVLHKIGVKNRVQATNLYLENRNIMAKYLQKSDDNYLILLML